MLNAHFTLSSQSVMSESWVCAFMPIIATIKSASVVTHCLVFNTLLPTLQGTREYNVGEGADIAAKGAAQQMGIEIPEGFQARQIQPERDIVQFDIVLVMDKYTAADVLREVCSAAQHMLLKCGKQQNGHVKYCEAAYSRGMQSLWCLPATCATC